MSKQALHENLTPKDKVKSGSNKSFGLVFTAVFMVIGLWPLFSGEPIKMWAISICGFLVFISYTIPKILAPFNYVWFLFGVFLHKCMNPLIMAFLFYSTVTPIGLTMRALGKCPLPLKFDPKANSYWIERQPPGPDPETMTNQF